MEMLGIEFATPVGKAASEAIKRVAADGNAECTVRAHVQTAIARSLCPGLLPVPRLAACARRPRVFAFVSGPIDTTPALGSLGYNQLCGVNGHGDGTYTTEGITKLCEALKGSSVISLECAAAPIVFAFVSAPIDTKANTFAFPSVSESEHVPFRTHIPCLARRNLPALARKRTRTHALPSPFLRHPRNAALHRPPRGPRPRPPVGRVGRACSRAHLTPLRPSPSQRAV